MSSARLRSSVAFTLLAAACTRPPEEGVLSVTVRLDESAAACVRVYARPSEGAEEASGAISTSGRQEVRVAILRGALTPAVHVGARGYSDADCQQPVSPPERADEREVSFLPGQVVSVELALRPVPVVVDVDQDGHAPVSAGGDDCDDSNPAIHPGMVEDCADSVDQDCDLAIDCADQDCDGRPCRSGGTCADRQCRAAQTETGLCDDGIDNDGDGAADCADSDCLGAACRDADPCTTGETCQAGGGCSGGGPVQCTSPPGACHERVGRCDPTDGGCAYGVDAGDPCADSDLCTVNEVCLPDGGCEGTPKVCASPPSACHLGECNPATGNCRYTVDIGRGCSDDDNCTVDDACAAGGACLGAPVTCTAPECQAFAGTCLDDGGCQFVPAPGPCDGGTCRSGACSPVVFPFTPSNFSEADLPTPSGAISLGCGESVINTTTQGNQPTFSNWCGQPTPGIALLPQAGGPELVLLSMDSLTVSAGARLRVMGSRPVILAVTGDVTLLGHLEAGARGSTPGAGGSVSCATGNGRGGNGVSASASGGGGGGGFGEAGGAGGRGGGTGGGSGGVAGIQVGNDTLVPLRGGCGGGQGAGGSSGPPGAGGGAVQLTVAGQLEVTGWISSRGGGGGGSSSNASGGSGAGSGGAILLEANQLLLGPDSVISANGGGGGSGSGGSTSGDPGYDGRVDGGAQALGGDGPTVNGGPGGNGGALAGPATAGTDAPSSAGGGGGGGGAVGRIRLNVAGTCTLEAGHTLSPPATGSQAGCP